MGSKVNRLTWLVKRGLLIAAALLLPERCHQGRRIPPFSAAFFPVLDTMIKEHTCERCGHQGPESDFMVNCGNVSKSCNVCLEVIFKTGKWNANAIHLARARNKGNEESTKAARLGKGRGPGRPRKRRIDQTKPQRY